MLFESQHRLLLGYEVGVDPDRWIDGVQFYLLIP